MKSSRFWRRFINAAVIGLLSGLCSLKKYRDPRGMELLFAALSEYMYSEMNILYIKYPEKPHVKSSVKFPTKA